MLNHNNYILFLQNTYDKRMSYMNVQNTGDEKFYKFENFSLPSSLVSGTYDFALVYCELEYTVSFESVLLETEITVTTIDGDTKTFKIKDLSPETGILKYDKTEKTLWYQLKNVKTEYYSL